MTSERQLPDFLFSVNGQNILATFVHDAARDTGVYIYIYTAVGDSTCPKYNASRCAYDVIWHACSIMTLVLV